MEILFAYLLKSSGLMAAFFVAYYLLLHRETFFNSNRWFLLAGLFTSVLLPLVSFTKVIWVDAAPQMYRWVPVHARVPVTEAGFAIDWSVLLMLAYAVGLFVFLLRFLFDFASLAKTLKGHCGIQLGAYTVVDAPHIVSPFSYFNYIAYNSSLYTDAELQNIIAHEKVHCSQKHSLDVLVAQLFCILFWFHPIVWLYRKAILQNLEFIADREALAQLEDRKAYQFTLLKVTAQPQCVAITNHFYQSLIKKRIVMLNKNQSPKTNVWKYAVMLPALAAFLFCFQIKTVAQERAQSTIATAPPPPVVTDKEVVINKKTTDAELKEYSERFDKWGAKLKFSKVKRNASGEITAVKIAYSDKQGQSANWHVKSDEPIAALRIGKDQNGNIAMGAPQNGQILRETVQADENNNTEAESKSSTSKSYSYTYDYDGEGTPEVTVNGQRIEMPDLSTVMADVKNNINIQSHTDSNGRTSMTINGEKIDIDPEKILAEIDIEAIKEEARAGAEEARREMERVRPELERAHKQRMKAHEHANRAQRDVHKAQREADETQREMDEIRREMEEARKDMEEARKDMEEARRAFQAQRQEIRSKNKSGKKQ